MYEKWQFPDAAVNRRGLDVRRRVFAADSSEIAESDWPDSALNLPAIRGK
jgi:hypothetical protein